MKNKRGDIPVTILVLGVVAICILAILSFFVSSFEMKKNFDIQIVKEAKLAREKFDIYTNLGFTKEEIDSALNIGYDPQGRYVLLQRGTLAVRYELPR
ncbi:MAG: hypothetical protein AABX50_01270 [Nanoarchaeota archaeon]